MPFPMGKGHLLSWGIRGHPLTRSWHFVYTKCVSCKSLAAFLSQKWNNVREMERGNVREMEQRSGVERGDVREWNKEMFQNGTTFVNGTRECIRTGTLERRWTDDR